jgi:hypothetical protein
MPVDFLYRENFSKLTNFTIESAHMLQGINLRKQHLVVVQPFLYQNDTTHQYASFYHDKQGSLPKRLHFDCRNLALQLFV